jgi:hypothetical protein
MNLALANKTQNCWFNCVVTRYFRFAIYLSPPHGISWYSAATWRQNTTFGHRIKDFVLTGRYKHRQNGYEFRPTCVDSYHVCSVHWFPLTRGTFKWPVPVSTQRTFAFTKI